MITIAGKDLTTGEEKMFRKWVNTLYAEKYPKATGMLQTPFGFCCLGAGCMVAIPKKQRELENGRLAGLFPSSQKNVPHWLGEISSDFGLKMGYDLDTLNDTGTAKLSPFTHAEIAMLLDMVYILKVLD